jgi:hypothetical protein
MLHNIQFLSPGFPGPISCHQATGDSCAVKCPEARHSDSDYSHAEAFPTQILHLAAEIGTCNVLHGSHAHIVYLGKPKGSCSEAQINIVVGSQ